MVLHREDDLRGQIWMHLNWLIEVETLSSFVNFLFLVWFGFMIMFILLCSIYDLFHWARSWMVNYIPWMSRFSLFRRFLKKNFISILNQEQPVQFYIHYSFLVWLVVHRHVFRNFYISWIYFCWNLNKLIYKILLKKTLYRLMIKKIWLMRHRLFVLVCKLEGIWVGLLEVVKCSQFDKEKLFDLNSYWASWIYHCRFDYVTFF